MRKNLLNIITCPKCKESAFSLKEDAANRLEIVAGTITCGHCKASFQVFDGIVDFLNEPNTGVLREREAMDSEDYITDESGNKYKITDETIQKFKDKFLALPKGDGSYIFKRGGSFQTIVEASDRFCSTLEYLRLSGKESVLEIGAAFGSFSNKFAQKGCYVVALDISNYLKVSKVFIEDFYFERVFADMHHTPFKDNTFDIVFGAAVIHHSSNTPAVFKEFSRILKPGGKVVLINEPSRGIFEKVHPVFQKMQDKGYGDVSYTVPEFKKNAQTGGLKNVKIEFLSLADDYITRHKNRDTPETNSKLKFARFFANHRKLDKLISLISSLPRLLLRPKSWRLIGYK